jgi:ABC-type tungstate transport system substrate-binding protein
VPDLWSFALVNVSTFIIASVYFVAQASYLLSLIPDHLQGRVNSIIRLLVGGSQPLGIVLTGLLIQFFGPIGTVLALFAPQLLLAVIMTIFYRRLAALS